MIDLRPYQREAIDSLYSYWTEQSGRNPLIVLPTGTGKSVVLAEFVREALKWQGTRIVVLTHVKELIEQDYAETMGIWPECPAGIYSAGLNRREVDAQVLFAGIQSIHKRAGELQWADLIVIDEAHLVPSSSNTMYRRFLGEMIKINPKLKIVGLTATHYRMDSGMLHTGENALFDDICYEAPLLDMVENGYLSPLTSKAMETKLDVSGVGKRGGEYIPSQLQSAVDIAEITSGAVDEIVKMGQDRKGWIVFCSGVDHSLHVRDEIRSRGYSCETIVGSTPAEERAQILADYKAQKIRCLASMNVLTTGFNAPHVDLIGMMRPTESSGLYVQMVGRGTRLSPNKKNCLVLDFAGNVERHGPVDAVNPQDKGGASEGGGDAPTKACPECQEIVLIAVRECPQCGYAYPEPEVKIKASASLDAIMSNQIKPVVHRVTRVDYRMHEKPLKPPSLRVDYFDGYVAVASEWICFEHTGYAHSKAVKWWRARMPGEQVPLTINEALLLKKDLPTPTTITTRKDGKYTRVLSCDFSDTPRQHGEQLVVDFGL
ncbi:MAG: DEAD/DEAH box helicase [Sneathiella sp.]